MRVIQTTMGTDPEFAWSISDDQPGKYRGLLPAKFMLSQIKKEMPGIVNDVIPGKSDVIRNEYGTIFADGASWEMNPNPGTPGQVVDNLAYLLAASHEYGRAATNENKRLSLIIEPSIPLDCRMLDKWGDPDLAMFGCDPDKSIHPRIVDPSCIDAPKHPWRYMGAHIHFGIEGLLDELEFNGTPDEFWLDDPQRIDDFMMVCDATVGLLGIQYDKAVSMAAEQRRTVYGQPGVYRLQRHGIEYRSPSNSWLLTPERAEAMLELAELVPTLYKHDITPELNTFRADIVETMVNGDSTYAGLLLHRVSEIICEEQFWDRLRFAQNQIDRNINNYIVEWDE